MDGVTTLFYLIVLFLSVTIHEVSHGVVALALGDRTAKEAGRLTLNPLKHLDPFGSLLLPLILILFKSPFLFAWAKPVPYNPYNLKNPRKDAALIAAAGPLSNLILALAFGILLRVVVPFFPVASVLNLIAFMNIVILLNIVLAVFNLVPIPPLDGSRILALILGNRAIGFQRALEQYGFVILLFFIFFAMDILFPIIRALYHAFAGPYAFF